MEYHRGTRDWVPSGYQFDDPINGKSWDISIVDLEVCDILVHLSAHNLSCFSLLCDHITNHSSCPVACQDAHPARIHSFVILSLYRNVSDMLFERTGSLFSPSVKLCEFFCTVLRTLSNLANKQSTSLSTRPCHSFFFSYLRSFP
jgi:hypothetical protein